jgi:hypothetical protein
MNAALFAPIIQAVLAGIALLITTLIGIYVPRAIAAVEARTGIQVSAQMQATVMQAATTAAGILQTKLDQGVLKITHITVTDPTVEAEAVAALARVPVAAAAMNKSLPSMIATIVGLVDTAPKPAVLTLAPAAPPSSPLLPRMTPA